MNTPYTDYPNLDLLLRNNGLNAPPAVMAEIRALFEELDRLRDELRFSDMGEDL